MSPKRTPAKGGKAPIRGHEVLRDIREILRQQKKPLDPETLYDLFLPAFELYEEPVDPSDLLHAGDASTTGSFGIVLPYQFVEHLTTWMATITDILRDNSTQNGGSLTGIDSGNGERSSPPDPPNFPP